MNARFASLLVVPVLGLELRARSHEPVGESRVSTDCILASTVGRVLDTTVVMDLVDRGEGGGQNQLELQWTDRFVSPPARRVLWRGTWFHGPPNHLSFAALPSGEWRLSASDHEGRGAGLTFWSGDARRDDDGALVTTCRHHPLLVSTIEMENTTSSRTGVAGVVRALESTQLYTVGEQFHLLGAGWDDLRTMEDGASFVWQAELPPTMLVEGRRLLGRGIAAGKTPRIARCGDRAWLTTRAPYARDDEHSPVRVYRSSDGLAWTPELDLWQAASARGTYALTAVDDVLWIATTEACAPDRIALHWLDRRTGRVSVLPRVSGQSVRSSVDPFVWVNRNNASDEPGLMYFVDGDGAWQLISVF